jgi:ubiquinone/menaquinone biosynthesis C-methylase UbiE
LKFATASWLSLVKRQQKGSVPGAFLFYLYRMKDNFSGHAERYAVYRPNYPQALFDFILSRVTHKRTAWDCATGNGQTATKLARVFEKVYATDISQRQLDNAPTADNVYYSLQEAEKTSFADGVFDLITVSQALHWFKFDQFYDEVRRVGKSGAVIAAWSYSLFQVNTDIDSLMEEFHFGLLDKYWDEERKYVDEGYKTIPFPFKEIETPSFQMQFDWTIEQVEGYLNTWSAVVKFIKQEQYNPVDELIKKIRNCVHEDTKSLTVVFPIHLRMGIV